MTCRGPGQVLPLGQAIPRDRPTAPTWAQLGPACGVPEVGPGSL